MLHNRAVLRSQPVFLRVCTSDLCNLRCPGCLLSQERVSGEDTSKRLMTFELFKRAVHDFVPYVLGVNLYDEGEPLLNRELCDMIRHLRLYHVATNVSSNFSLRLSDQTLEEFVDCGLDRLIVAVDGATQETYSRYRQGASLDLVLYNLRRLSEMQRRRRRCPLRLEIQFIEFEHNRHERTQIAELARDLNAWRFSVVEGSSPEGWRGTDFQGSEAARLARGCYQLWVSAHINSDGSVGVCDYGEDHGMPQIGWAWEYRSAKLRNHPTLTGLRRSFAGCGKNLDSICRRCSLYRRT
ncbi:MAG: radical SAM protein [Thermoguttaceae bacterium]